MVTEEDLANLSNKQLQDMCKIRGVAIYGAKPAGNGTPVKSTSNAGQVYGGSVYVKV